MRANTENLTLTKLNLNVLCIISQFRTKYVYTKKNSEKLNNQKQKVSTKTFFFICSVFLLVANLIKTQRRLTVLI